MPTPVQHVSNVVNTELERVSSKVPTLFEREDTFYSTIEKKNVEVVSGRSMLVPLEIRAGGNFGAFDPEGEGTAGNYGGASLGRGTGPLFDKATIPVFNLKMGVEWTKKAEWASDSSRKAVVNTVRHLLATSMAQFRRHVDSLSMTAGRGVLATISGTTTAAGYDDVALATDGFGARLLVPGQEVGIVTSSYATRSNTTDVVVTYVDYAAKTARLTGHTASIAATDLIIIGNMNGAATTDIQNVWGVAYHHNSASTGDWSGLNRANYPEIRANRVNAGTSALALPFARRAINMIGDRIGQDQMGKVQAWMHPCQKQAYEELGQLVSVIQKQSSSQGLDLYFGDNMQLAGAPVRVHFSWDKKRIDFVNPSLWGRAEMVPAGFYDVDGRKTFEIRYSDGGVTPKQIFYLVVSMNLFHMNPAGASYIDGLTVPTGY